MKLLATLGQLYTENSLEQKQVKLQGQSKVYH
jgi:hypothetical protein